MPESLAVILVLNHLVNAAVSGFIGAALAARLATRRGPVMLLSILLPWLGLLAAPVLARGRGALRPRPARRGPVLGAVLLVLVGIGFLAGSLTSEWASVQGSVHEFAQSYSGRVGDTTGGLVVVGSMGLIMLALLAGAMARGGFRFAIPLAWLSCGAALTLLDLAVGSSLLSGLAEQVTSLSGGHAAAGLWVGAGTRLALIGTTTTLLGSLGLIWHARVSTPATVTSPRSRTRADATWTGREADPRADASVAPSVPPAPSWPPGLAAPSPTLAPPSLAPIWHAQERTPGAPPSDPTTDGW